MDRPRRSRRALLSAREVRFRALYQRYSELWRIAMRMCGDHQLAEEATASVFNLAWERLESVPEGPDAELAWLVQMTWNRLRIAHRSEERRQAMQERLRREVLLIGRRATEIDDPAPLIQAFRALSVEDRTVLVLAGRDGLTPLETATALGITPGAAANRLWRARARLTRAFDELDAAEEGDRG